MSVDQAMMLDESSDDASAPTRRVKELITHQKSASDDLWVEKVVDNQVVLEPKGAAEGDDPDRVFDDHRLLVEDTSEAGQQQVGGEELNRGTTSAKTPSERPKRTRPPPGWFTDL